MAFVSVVVVFIAGGIAFGISWIRQAWWLNTVAIVVATVIGWIVGATLSAMNDVGANDSIDVARAVGQTFWYSLFGAGMGVWQARKRKKRNSVSANPLVEPRQTRATSDPQESPIAPVISSLASPNVKEPKIDSEEAAAARCKNPDCNRLIPPKARKCLHCGTPANW